MRLIHFHILKATSSHTFSSTLDENFLILKLALAGTDTIELGNDHIAASLRHIQIYGNFKNKELVDISAHIYNIDELNDDRVAKLKPSPNHIGNTRLYEYTAPLLLFSIGFSGKAFNDMRDRLFQGQAPTGITLEVDGFDYYGNQLKWDIDLPESVRPSANIETVYFNYEILNPTELDLERAHSSKQEEDEKRQRILKSTAKLEPTLKSSQTVIRLSWAFFIIAIVCIFFIKKM